MFVNDLTGLCRTNVFGGDVTSQIPVGLHSWGNVPFGLGYNAVNPIFNPAYNYLYNRVATQGFVPQGFVGQGFVPQGFVPQGFVPQGFVHQGFVPQTFGQVNPIAQGFSPFVAAPFAGTMPQHTGILPNQINYGFANPYAALCNWNTAQGITGLGLGVQNTICR